MYSFQEKIIENNQIHHYYLYKNNDKLSFEETIKLLETDEAFRNLFIKILEENPFEAYFFEVKPIKQNQWKDIFEFVLVKSTRLAQVSANPQAFQKYFKKDKKVITFKNLGGDAQLIVPCPIARNEHYTHLAQFIRNTSYEQQHALIQLMAKEYRLSIGNEYKWLSTSGLGVYWLHIRIDSRPKYYTYLPYKNPF